MRRLRGGAARALVVRGMQWPIFDAGGLVTASEAIALESCLGAAPLVTPVTMEDAMAVLGILAVVAGVIGVGVDFSYKFDEKGWWGRYIDRTIGQDNYDLLMIGWSVVSATLLSWFDVLTDVFVLMTYAACGATAWLACGVTILVGANVYIAYNAQRGGGDWKERCWRFALCLAQLDIVVESHLSLQQRRKTLNFARSKFLEGLLESCPQAFLSMYVVYAVKANAHFWLILSTVVSIVSLAYGLSEWLEVGIDERVRLHTFWYHHLTRTTFFSVDFALRLLTVALILAEPAFQPYGAVLLCTMALGYLAIAFTHTQDPGEAFKVFGLSFFIFMLPAELRRRQDGARFLFLVDEKMRRPLINPLLFMRIVDFLSATGMIMLSGAQHNTSRRGLALGVLIVADVVLLWCVRAMTDHLEGEHNLVRQRSASESKALKEAADA